MKDCPGLTAGKDSPRKNVPPPSRALPLVRDKPNYAEREKTSSARSQHPRSYQQQHYQHEQSLSKKQYQDEGYRSRTQSVVRFGEYRTPSYRRSHVHSTAFSRGEVNRDLRYKVHNKESSYTEYGHQALQ